MNFLELADTRHSCRWFLPTPVDADKLNHIYEAIRLAPTAGNLQAYAVREVKDEKTKTRLCDFAVGQQCLIQAPVVLAFFAVPELSASKYGDRGMELYCVQDATIACTYAQLEAHDLGLASCWIGAFNAPLVSNILKAEWSWRPVALLPIGYAGSKSLTSPPKSDRVQTYDSTVANWRSRLW